LDYDTAKVSEIMKGQQVVISFLGTMSLEPTKTFIDLAKDAGVSVFVPNVWAVDYRGSNLPG